MAEDTTRDPAQKARHGNTKAAREDWRRAARNALVHRGAGEVKILALAQELGVARSSFYWYFRDRADLEAALLEEWETRNTRYIIEKVRQPAETINHAICHFFECFIDPKLFDQGLDFAVREWSRRDPALRARIDAADSQRIRALIDLFTRYGFDLAEADARARILYFMQLGYHALEVKEGMPARMARLHGYLKGFTGEEPPESLIDSFSRRAEALEAKA